MDSVAISEDSLEHSEHGTQNATLVSILGHPPMRLHGNYCCDYTQAWHI